LSPFSVRVGASVSMMEIVSPSLEEGVLEETPPPEESLPVPPVPPALAAEAALAGFASRLSSCAFVTQVEEPMSSERQIALVCTAFAKKSPIPFAALANHCTMVEKSDRRNELAVHGVELAVCGELVESVEVVAVLGGVAERFAPSSASPSNSMLTPN